MAGDPIFYIVSDMKPRSIRVGITAADGMFCAAAAAGQERCIWQTSATD